MAEPTDLLNGMRKTENGTRFEKDNCWNIK